VPFKKIFLPLKIWDTRTQKRIHNIKVHEMRIGCLAWNDNVICSGSRDRCIIYRDLRESNNVTEKRLNAHRQEVFFFKNFLKIF